MKDHLEQLIQHALTQLKQVGKLSLEELPTLQIERTRDKAHGDFASNIALVLAKTVKLAPRMVAEMIVAAIPASPQLSKVEIAGAGFINFYLNEAAATAIVATILQAGKNFGHSTRGNGIRLLLEFVSSNPTGPLHVGHGRQAAYGSCVANLLDAVGYKVHREYYVNDAGRQMAIIAVSVWLRYLELYGEKIVFPTNGYQGDYVRDIAAQLKTKFQNKLLVSTTDVFKNLPLDEQPDGSGDKEAHMDALIKNAKRLLGKENYQAVTDYVRDIIVDEMREDLKEFGVVFDEWFSERSLLQNKAFERAVEKLKAGGFTYERDGALWFRSSEYGDEKDRVLIRNNGEPTYFAPDVAYHFSKFERGYNKVIDVLGADHHGYVPRIRASIAALQGDPNKIDVALVQFVSLYRGTEKLPMSTRAGTFVTLRELRTEVGNDATRFFYIYRKHEQHLDFDLELAKSNSNENPVYYIQYAHARVCSVMRQLREKGFTFDQASGLKVLNLLNTDHEKAVLTQLTRFPEIVESSALGYDPHRLAHYLQELANVFHGYYNAQQFIVEDEKLRNARLCLILATKQVIANGLTLLGISTPEAM